MGLTSREREYKRLKDDKGVALWRHPSHHLLQTFVNTPPNGDVHTWVMLGQGEVERRRNEFVMAVVVIDVVMITMTVEELNALMREAHEEADASIQAVHVAYNKVKAVSEVLIPELHDITKHLRSSRQTAELEMRDMLKWLTTVREFFLESRYEVEMKRLREFIDLCKEIQALKDAGTLDAVANLAIALAVKERTDG